MQKLFEDWRKYVAKQQLEENIFTSAIGTVAKVADKGMSADQIAQGVEGGDDSLGLADVVLGGASLLAKTPVAAATIALFTWILGSTARANKEWNALPEDHPRKVAHRKHLARVKKAMDAQSKRAGLSQNIDVDAETGEAFDPTDMDNPIVKKEWEKGMERMKKVLNNDMGRIIDKNPSLIKDPKKKKETEELTQWIMGQ